MSAATTGHVPDVLHIPYPSDCGEGDAELAQILDDLDDYFATYVAFPTIEAQWAVAAWAVHCWIIDAFESTPRLAVLSPEKGSGKTRVLECLELVVPWAIHTVNMSPSALFRSVSERACTLLLDEADTYLGLKNAEKHEDIRGLVNAGHRRGAKATRVQMRGNEAHVVEMSAFAPVALAGIGDLPDTIMDRSVVIAMKRRAQSEHVQPFRMRKAKRSTGFYVERLQAWAANNLEQLQDLEPVMPDGIVDRPADVWEPLIIIGDAASPEWSQRLRQAAVVLNDLRARRDPSLGMQLLRDLWIVFDHGDRTQMFTSTILTALTDIEDAPWSDLRGQSIDARGLARRLKPYEVRSGKVRVGELTAQGYRREDLWDAWERYCPDLLGSPPVSPEAEHPEHPEHHSHPSGDVELF